MPGPGQDIITATPGEAIVSNTDDAIIGIDYAGAHLS